MEPTESYNRSKRNTIWFSGLLVLSVIVGIKPTTDHSSLFPFTLEKPELLSEVLVIALIYFFIQYLMDWYLQTQSVRSVKINSYNFILTSSISIVSLLIYIGDKIPFSRISIQIGNFLQTPARWAIDFYPLAAGSISLLSATFIAYQLSKKIDRALSNASINRTLLRNAEKEKIIRNLTTGFWVLNFNPRSSSAKKAIEFKENGEIGDGRNNNENSWRMNNNLLEIISSDGKVFSRFLYVESEDRFLHTNDDDTLSIKSQIIYRDPTFFRRI